MGKNNVEEFIDTLVGLRELAEFTEKKNVKVTVSLDELENARIEKVCKELGQKRATFMAGATMEVVLMAENKLGLNEDENYYNNLLNELGYDVKEAVMENAMKKNMQMYHEGVVDNE